jgi:hypothetical protein
MIANLVAGFLGVGGGVATDYESIATANGTGSSGTITFSGIPSTYTHLQIRGFARSSRAANSDFVYIRLNSDSGSNYSVKELLGNGTSATRSVGTSSVWGWCGYAGAQSNATNFGDLIVDIHNYANTNMNTTIRTLTGYDANGNGAIALESTAWLNTAAVTSVSLVLDSFNFSTGTTFALYGIK